MHVAWLMSQVEPTLHSTEHAAGVAPRRLARSCAGTWFRQQHDRPCIDLRVEEGWVAAQHCGYPRFSPHPGPKCVSRKGGGRLGPSGNSTPRGWIGFKVFSYQIRYRCNAAL